MLTEYSPPASSKLSQEYRQQFQDESDTNFKISKVTAVNSFNNISIINFISKMLKLEFLGW